MKVTIYTDSQYGFGIVHDFGQLWSKRGFMTSSGSPVKNGERIRELLHAIQLPGEVAVVKCSAHSKSQDYGPHSDPGGHGPPGPGTEEAPPTGWRCFKGKSDRGGKAAVRKGKPAVSRRFSPAPGNPPRRRCKQRRHGDSDPLPASLFLAVYTARKRLAGTDVVGPLGAPAVPMPLAPNRAPLGFSVSAKQTLKIATGATAPVAHQQLRRLHSEPASSLLGLSRWAGGRPFGGRPPTQRESQNDRRGHLTAVRSFGGLRPAGGARRPPGSE
ncbi:hypothetical protein NDU88_004893 [Pleurodeles waltl]|uniref:RNase H type-1 domain-containing protein n=1 Tax=Pleurodeles waltl TaxID=8319 RepID=A0AAV7W9X3_PLEWA|nr:hypothetical protein NDU88_004893 [Pleurodeles waltl]